ncbi:hypothetical protein [Alteribacter natronophilus]|uniref:hypothetical protein n=1 Tax=Alteribacter natronophilus TaxID=2583810 RepID=UPI00110E081D|nr:hypothetical protein [Alteribacter natronophilus]TMW73925.1 hypothetical protein FGB90_06540 [Alteribacter natronophilus]
MNGFFIVSGILAIVTCFAHAAWGEKRIIKDLRKSDATSLTKASFHVSWHQLTAFLFVTGSFLTLYGIGMPITFFDFFIAYVLSVFLAQNIVFIALNVRLYPETFLSALYPVINVFIMVGFIVLGSFLL